jgi:hypothetical protein
MDDPFNFLNDPFLSVADDYAKEAAEPFFLYSDATEEAMQEYFNNIYKYTKEDILNMPIYQFSQIPYKKKLYTEEKLSIFKKISNLFDPYKTQRFIYEKNN